MPEIVAAYQDGVAFRVDCRGHTLLIDQPLENEGEDLGMTPPELFASSLAGCVGYYVARYCRQAGISTVGLKVSCSWRTAEQPKRLHPIHIDIDLPGLPDNRRRAVERVAGSCLLHATLTHQPEVEITLRDHAHA